MTFKPSKISFCTFQKPDQISGVDTWIKNVSLELKAMGYDPHILGVSYGQGEFPLIEFARRNNIEHDQIKRKDHESLEGLLKTILVVLKRRKSDIFLPGYCTPAFFLTPYLRKANIPCVLVLHSDDERYRAYFDEFVVKQSDYKVDGVVAVSDYLYSWCDKVHDFNFPKALIEYGVNVPKHNKKYNEGSRLKLVYSGRLVQEQKRIFDILESFKLATEEYSDVECNFLGDGPDKMTLIDRINDFGEERIRYVGSVDSIDIQSELVKHDVLVLLSDYEGLPLAMLEAMACGMVVICLNISSGIGQVLVHKENGIIVQDRKTSFLEAIDYLITNEVSLETIGANARKTVIENYSSTTNAKKWIRFLNRFEIAKTPEIQIPQRIEIPKTISAGLAHLMHNGKSTNIFLEVKRIIYRHLSGLNRILPTSMASKIRGFYRRIIPLKN